MSTFSKILPCLILIPAAVFVLFQLGCTTIAPLLGLGVAAVMTALYAVFTTVVTPMAVKFLRQINGPEQARFAAYLPAVPVYLGILFIPIGILAVAKPFLPADTSITIAWLSGLVLTVPAVSMLQRKGQRRIAAQKKLAG